MTRRLDPRVHPCVAILHLGIVHASGRGLGAPRALVESQARERMENACGVEP